MSVSIKRADIEGAYQIIAPHIRLTPIFRTNGTEFGLSPFSLTLKLEHLQFAGSFKTRGAFANLLLRRVPAAGVVAASGGNHGAAVAYAAMRIGCPARIFVPTVSSPAKVERIRAYGADLCITGDCYADALEASEAWTATSGALPVHAFDQRETVLGQGTLALELSAQAPEIDTLLVAVGGGGLIGGIAAWHRGATRVIGVEPCAAPTLTNALRAGCPVDAPGGGLAADSLAPRRVGVTPFAIAREFVEEVILVDDADIVRAQEALWEFARLVAEPGGATACAALVSGAYTPAADERVGVIVSGGNTSAVSFERLPRLSSVVRAE
jgi:threonine dehydratase